MLVTDAMNQIKFSHIYCKMPTEADAVTPVAKATLLAVFIVDRKTLSLEFITYDTTYIDGDHLSNYELPKSGNVIILLLQSKPQDSNSELWTTVRRWTPEKEKYYRSGIGSIFEIVVDKVIA
jgi:hypothetical protein